MSVRLPTTAERALRRFHVDFEPGHRQPSAYGVLVATIGSIVFSLAADALLVAVGTRIFPTTRGYPHFVFSDYAELTIAGVIIACLAWPIVTRVTSAPRWLFFRLALVVTAVLLLPDLMILVRGQPARAVGVLMAMHVAIAVITYNFLVRGARVSVGDRSAG